MTIRYGTGLSALVVDDEPAVRLVLQRLLEMAAFDVECAENLAGANLRRAARRFDLILTDKNLPDGSGLDLVRATWESGEDTEVIVMTAHASVESAMAAIRFKVADYLLKPFENLDEVHDRVRRAVEHLQLRRQNRALVGELRDKNARLEDLVVRDGLTGLYNHVHFQERLETEVARSARNGHHLGVLFVDLDHFKAVNDGVGHQAGDAILKGIGRMLLSTREGLEGCFSVREQDVGARYGGDEFVLLLPETTKGGAVITAERLRWYVEQAHFGGGGIHVTVSIGVAAYPADGHDRETLLRAADSALYAAKRLGRNRVMTFSPALVGEAVPSVSPEQSRALERSLLERSFRLLYQPIVETESWKLFGYEALCRPADPALGSIVEAIATAEATGRMVELGRLLRQLAVAPIGDLAEPSLLFINLHPQELADLALIQLEPFMAPWTGRIVLEISESIAIKDYEAARRTVQRLHDHGFRIALDDLGAGYSGLHALAQLEADFVKLDRSLVRNIHEDDRTSRLLKHILDYAETEGLVVIAEGIETEEEWQVVKDLGCPLMQGYYISPPERGFVEVQARAPAALATQNV